MFEKKRILGIDPGLTRCGIGVVEGAVGRPPVFIAVGVVRTSPDLDVAHRLLQQIGNDREREREKELLTQVSKCASSCPLACYGENYLAGLDAL
mgnify:FL=1